VTYRRDPNSPMSEALCSMRSDPDAVALRFFTEAWKAAYAKARSLGWLWQGIVRVRSSAGEKKRPVSINFIDPDPPPFASLWVAFLSNA
jgi:hypothetical protein